MKTYATIDEAVKELKERTGSGRVVYFVDGRQVHVSEFRVCEKPISDIYRSGLEIHAKKGRLF